MGKRPLRCMYDFSSEEAQKLLHNKFVVILGDSIQRTIYKDLVRFLQDEGLLTFHELTVKGKESFWHDHLVEFEGLSQETNYREVRQYRTDHHLVRVYFITRIYSDYMESILEDFKTGPVPDLLILNSCVWDLNRYADCSSRELSLQKAFKEYRENLQILFQKLHDILPTSCLIIWNAAMPVSDKVEKAYVPKGKKNLTTPVDILKANFDSATLACCYEFDVLDLNFCFRFFSEHRAKDGVHWDGMVHRFITKVLLTHVANSWGVNLKKKHRQNGIAWNGNAGQHPVPRYQPPPPRPPPPPPLHCPSPRATYANSLHFPQLSPSYDANFHHDSIPESRSVSLFVDFENNQELPDSLRERQYSGFHGPAMDYALDGGQAFPSHYPVGQGPGGGWGFPPPPDLDYMPDGGQGVFAPHPRWSPQDFRDRHRNARVMRQQHYSRQHYRPYSHPSHGTGGHPQFPAPPYIGCRGW